MGEFYDRMADDPDRSTYPDIPTGMRRLTEDKHIMRVSEISLKSFLKANQHTQPAVRVFGPERPYYPSFIFTKHSPLSRLFSAAVTQLQESGIANQIRYNWEGEYTKESGIDDVMVVGLGQMIAAFGMVAAAAIVALTVLALENMLRRCF